jgi:hypothetical protein
MVGQSIDNFEQRAPFAFAGEGRHPGRCRSRAFAPPWAPACAKERVFVEVDR